MTSGFVVPMGLKLLAVCANAAVMQPPLIAWPVCELVFEVLVLTQPVAAMPVLKAVAPRAAVSAAAFTKERRVKVCVVLCALWHVFA